MQLFRLSQKSLIQEKRQTKYDEEWLLVPQSFKKVDVFWEISQVQLGQVLSTHDWSRERGTLYEYMHMVKRCWSLKLPEQRLKHWSFAVYIVNYTTQLRADLLSHYKDPYKPKCHVRVLLQFILRIVYRELRNRMRGDTVTAIQEAFESGWPTGVCPNGPVGRGGKSLVVEFSNGERDIESTENGLEMDRNDTSSLLICLFVNSLGVQPSNGSRFLNRICCLIHL